MSSFLSDTEVINSNLNLEPSNIEMTVLKAAFLPYYVDPVSMRLTVVLKRSILKGMAARTDIKMGLTALKIELPEETPLTIEEAYDTLHINATLQDPIPFGSVMPNPENSTETIEMVLAHIDPPQLLDESRGILFQKEGEYEIGIVAFDELLEAIQKGFIQDVITRMMLSELYILAIDEAQNQEQNPQQMYESKSSEGVIGAGNNYPNTTTPISENDLPSTTDIPEEILEQNQQMDFGAIYAKK